MYHPKNCRLIKLTTTLLGSWKSFMKNMILNGFVLPSQLEEEEAEAKTKCFDGVPCVRKSLSEFFCMMSIVYKVYTAGHQMLAPIFCSYTMYFPTWWIRWHFGKNVRVHIQSKKHTVVSTYYKYLENNHMHTKASISIFARRISK